MTVFIEEPRDLPPTRLKFDVPGIWRQRVRAHIDFLGLESREYKGWYFSTFVVVGPSDKVAELNAWVRARS
jgi:hypothetical protein